MKKKFKIIIGIVLALAVCAYMAVMYFTPLTVEGEAVAKAPLRDSFSVQGQVMPQHSLVLNAPASGILQSLPFKPGMPVEEGQELLKISAVSLAELAIQKEQLLQQLATAEYQQQQLFSSRGQAQQQAALDAANSAYQLAETQYQAALQVERELGGVYTAAHLAELENAVKAAKQAVAAAQAQGGSAMDRSYYSAIIASTQAQLAALDEQQQNAALLAPYTGVVWQLLAEEGAYVTKNQPLLKMYQSAEMKIEVSLLSSDSQNVRLGDIAQVSLSGGQSFSAQVSFISPVAEQSISSLGLAENRCIVELLPTELPPGFGAGYQLDVLFTNILSEDALAVSAAAIVPLEKGSGVYVVENGKAQLKPVETGVKSGGRVEIVSGLKAGDFVISDPYDAGIKDGSRVTVE